MCKRRSFAAFILVIVCYTVSACAPAAPQLITIPTLAVLPSATPLPTDTPQATATRTPNLLETQIGQLNATNAAAQQTLEALLTRNAATDTPVLTLTSSPTITSTVPPSATMTYTATPPQVVAMQPQPVYAINGANLRTCASRECESVAQLLSGSAVMANGTIEGEAIDAVHSAWFRVDYQGRVLYVYSQLVSIIAPVPPTSVPIFVPPVEVAPPISVPPSSGNCPSLSATCGSLTCEQAYACLAAGNGRLDGDDDGVPCESICLGD